MSFKQEALKALEMYRQNMIKIVGESSELVKVIETCQRLVGEVEDDGNMSV